MKRTRMTKQSPRALICVFLLIGCALPLSANALGECYRLSDIKLMSIDESIELEHLLWQSQPDRIDAQQVSTYIVYPLNATFDELRTQWVNDSVAEDWEVYTNDVTSYGRAFQSFNAMTEFTDDDGYLYKIQLGGLWDYYWYCCEPAYGISFDYTREAEMSNQKVTALSIEIEEARNTALGWLSFYDGALLSSGEVFGYNGYHNIPYYRVSFSTTVDDLPLLSGSYDIEAFPDDRTLLMGGINIYVTGWGIAQIEGYFYQQPQLQEKDVAIISSQQALQVLDRSDEIFLRGRESQVMLTSITLCFYLKVNPDDASSYIASPCWLFKENDYTGYIVDALNEDVFECSISGE